MMVSMITVYIVIKGTLYNVMWHTSLGVRCIPFTQRIPLWAFQLFYHVKRALVLKMGEECRPVDLPERKCDSKDRLGLVDIVGYNSRYPKKNRFIKNRNSKLNFISDVLQREVKMVSHLHYLHQITKFNSQDF